MYKDLKRKAACQRRYYLAHKAIIAYQSKKSSLEHPLRSRWSRRDYYLRHKESINAKTSTYRKLHPDQNRRACKKWAAKNQDHVRMARGIWRAKHREHNNNYFLIRRNVKRGNGGSFTAAEWLALCRRFSWRCCGCRLRTKLTVDHIIPVSLGGTSFIENIQPLCQSCNSKKLNKLEFAYQ